MLIIDCEIINAIPPDDPEDRKKGVSYCDGWHDYKGMGVSVCCAYSYLSENYLVFLEDNLPMLIELIPKHDLVIGFNITGFDLPLLSETFGIPCRVLSGLAYDLQKEIWRADGLPGVYDKDIHRGYSLEKVIRANFPNIGKTASGAKAPEWWQHGFRGEVINYCLNDVRITKMLTDRILSTGGAISPVSQKFIKIRRPV